MGPIFLGMDNAFKALLKMASKAGEDIIILMAIYTKEIGKMILSQGAARWRIPMGTFTKVLG